MSERMETMNEESDLRAAAESLIPRDFVLFGDRDAYALREVQEAWLGVGNDPSRTLDESIREARGNFVEHFMWRVRSAFVAGATAALRAGAPAPVPAHGVTPGTNGTRGGGIDPAELDALNRGGTYIPPAPPRGVEAGDGTLRRRSLWDSLTPEQRERALRPVDGPEVCGRREDVPPTPRGVVRDADEGAGRPPGDAEALVSAFESVVHWNAVIDGKEAVSAYHDDERVDEDGPRQALLAALRGTPAPTGGAHAAEQREARCECGHVHETVTLDGTTSVFHRCRAKGCECNAFRAPNVEGVRDA